MPCFPKITFKLQAQ